MTKRLLTLLLCLLALTALGGAAVAQDATEDPAEDALPTRASSTIRVGHFAVGVGPVDLYVDEVLVAEAVAYGRFSDYTPLASDDFVVQVLPTGADPLADEALLDDAYAVDPLSDVNIYVIGADEASVEVLTTAYTLSPDLVERRDVLSSLLVHNFVDGLDDVTAFYEGEPIGAALSYTDDVGVAVEVTDEPVLITFVGADDVEVAAVTVTFVPGGDYVVVLYGTPDDPQVAVSAVDLLTGEALDDATMPDADATEQPAA